MKNEINVGDLVRITKPSFIGIVMKVDRTQPSSGYEKRYWIKISGKDITFPFRAKRVERIN